MDKRIDEEWFKGIDQAIDEWKENRKNGSTLEYAWSPARFIIIEDNRIMSKHIKVQYQSPVSEIYEIAGLEISTPISIKNKLKRNNIEVDSEFISKCLERFVERKLAIHESGKYLALAIPKNMQFWHDNE